MITTEQRSQALALQTGLAFAGQKIAPIAAINVNFPDGSYRFCQYPADSFCLFKRDQKGQWQYESCTCQIKNDGNEQSLANADQLVRFPDFFDRVVLFARYGDQTGLFVNYVFKGFLASGGDDDDGCSLHGDVIGWDGKGNDDDDDDDDDGGGDTCTDHEAGN